MAGDRLRRVIREPLLHFALLGAAVFGVWRVTEEPPVPPSEASDTTIVVSRAVQDRIAGELQKKLGRPPTDEQRQAAIDSYVNGELLYREGVALGLDQDDPMVRRRVIKKMEFVSTNLELPDEPDEAALRKFMADYPERYAGPPRFDFEMVTLLRAPEETDDARAQAALQNLRGGADAKSIEGRYASGKRFASADLGKTYGMELAAAVAELPPGEWGMIPFDKGWTLVHLQAQHAGDAPPFEKVRNRVQLDWKQSQRGVAMRERLEELRDKYQIELEP